MPARQHKVCSAIGCTALTDDKSGRCPLHPRQAWVHKTVPTERIRGRKLMRMRATLFSRHPLCEVCEKKDPPRLTVATIRDHVIPLAEGGADDESNEQAICVECHDEKSAEEKLRGIARWNDKKGGAGVEKKDEPARERRYRMT